MYFLFFKLFVQNYMIRWEFKGAFWGWVFYLVGWLLFFFNLVSIKSEKWYFQASLMIFICLEAAKLTSRAIYPLPDQPHQQNKGDRGIMLPLPPRPSMICVVWQGQSEVKLLFLVSSEYRFPKMEATFKTWAEAESLVRDSSKYWALLPSYLHRESSCFRNSTSLYYTFLSE